MNSGKTGRKRIAVMFGGRSVEHEISVITALQLIDAMDVVKYEPVHVYIAPSGKWYCGAALANRDFYKNMPGSLSDVQEVTLLPKPGVKGLTVLKQKKAQTGWSLFKQAPEEEEIIPVDVFFPAFHGSFGEDGCIQGLLELAEVTYTGSDVVSSAVSMSKYHCKKFLESHGIPVLPSALVYKESIEAGLGSNLAQVRQSILGTPGMDKFPLFVKPANLGSSIGISKAADEAGLDAALLNAFKYDYQALVEPCLENKMEINVAVLDDVAPVSSVVEIPVASGEELSYEDKYMRGGGKGKKGGGGPQTLGMAGLTRVINPENLDAETKELARSYARDAFIKLGCAGVARIDFMLDLSSNKLYFNEINPLPGSLSYYLWVKSEPVVLYTDMLTKIIERAEIRQSRKQMLNREMGFKAMFKQ
jgi:D-alanine-D-alanine ligase